MWSVALVTISRTISVARVQTRVVTNVVTISISTAVSSLVSALEIVVCPVVVFVPEAFKLNNLINQRE